MFQPPAAARRILFACLPLLMAEAAGRDEGAAALPDPLARRYEEGEVVRYSMTGSHATAQRTTRYAAECEGTVLRREDGAFHEEVRWTRLEVDGVAVALDEPSASFRQQVSLDAAFDMPMPDIRGVHPGLIGPIFDLMTFYVDLHPDLRGERTLVQGEPVRVPHGKPNSWADGAMVVIGEDCIDFELTLVEVAESTARLRVRHVPPREGGVRLPADWMRAPVGSTPNNWVQVTKLPAGGWQAAVGCETFDVDIELALPSGRIERAVMDNPVELISRTCSDEALTRCGEPQSGRIHRRIELRAR